MKDELAAASLMRHVRFLAQIIGPRPAGHLAEAQARDYIRRILVEAGIMEMESLPFQTWDTWMYSMAAPLALSLSGNFMGRLGRIGKFLGGLTSLLGAYLLWQGGRYGRQPLGVLYPKWESANLVTRLASPTLARLLPQTLLTQAPQTTPSHKVVLVAHTDTNKHRPSYSPERKSQLVPLAMLGSLLPVLNGLGLLIDAFTEASLARLLHSLSGLGVASLLPVIYADDQGKHIDGANDNASAVACLLGLGAYLKQNPLQNTEVWLAFTGAEEVGCVGMHHLLDIYGAQLQDAWFIDFEMVGAKHIAYVTEHSGLSVGGGYMPDAESLAVAVEASRRHPELGIQGHPLMLLEEIGALRGRGFRGLCLAGVGEDGWPANWRQSSDTVAHIQPEGLERAARFALAMLKVIDER